MAKKLNKNRIRNSWLIGLFLLITVIFSRSMFADETVTHEIMDLSGYVLVTICAIGRVYTSAFLGGFKNQALITYGPFSVVRNPLYFFSLLGFFGISLMSTHISVIIVTVVGFGFIYSGLIRREERFLIEKFGAEYKKYMKKVPRILPNPKLYSCPQEISMQPTYLNRAALDAVWWFVPLPFMELLEYLANAGYLHASLLVI